MQIEKKERKKEKKYVFASGNVSSPGVTNNNYNTCN